MPPHSETRTARSEIRVYTDVDIRVFGLDGAGQAFYQDTSTIDISRNGARLRNLERWEAPGEIIGLRHGLEKARYRVVWIGGAGGQHERQVGLFCLDYGKQIWQNVLDEYEQKFKNDTESYGPLPGCRRQFWRHQASGRAQARELGAALWRWAILSNISEGGCYLETPTPLPPKTKVEATLNIAGMKLQIMGKVISCQPSLGMGLQFTQLSRWNIRQLQELVTAFAKARLSS